MPKQQQQAAPKRAEQPHVCSNVYRTYTDDGVPHEWRCVDGHTAQDQDRWDAQWARNTVGTRS